MIVADILFTLFAALLAGSALMVICARNPVHSVLFLIFAFFNAAGLFVMIGAEYLAMTLVIVYVGAVAVLFLFVVMMMDIDVAALRQGFLRYLPLGGAVAAVLFAQFALLYRAVAQTEFPLAKAVSPADPAISNTKALGMILYTDYVYAFQMAGAILLVAMIGAILLTHREGRQVHRQSIGRQVSRRREDAVALVSVKNGEGA